MNKKELLPMVVHAVQQGEFSNVMYCFIKTPITIKVIKTKDLYDMFRDEMVLTNRFK